MTETISPIIQTAELLSIFNQPDLIIIDASNGENSQSNFLSEHIYGAQFVDLNTQLADMKEDVSNGGRHPLPSLEHFSQVLTSLGITPESHVLIYDDKNGANAAARFWWMLKAVDHQKVQVLDGGLHAAKRIGIMMSNEITKANKCDHYAISKWTLPIAQTEEVQLATKDHMELIIDVRAAPRYNGETEPIDLIAGHIPKAINHPFTENLDDNGFFLSPDKLREKYIKVFDGIKSDDVIVHCGSGVTACHTLLAIAHAGLDIPKLYVGSWSEWSRNNMPMAINKS